MIYFDDNPETDFLAINVKHVDLKKEGRGIIGEGNAQVTDPSGSILPLAAYQNTHHLTSQFSRS